MSSVAGLLSELPRGQGVLTAAWDCRVKVSKPDVRAVTSSLSTGAHISNCRLQVARHTGDTVAFHMKNYGNFTKVGGAVQLTPAHAAMYLANHQFDKSAACSQHVNVRCFSMQPRIL